MNIGCRLIGGSIGNHGPNGWRLRAALGNSSKYHVLGKVNEPDVYVDKFTNTVHSPDKITYENRMPRDSAVQNDFEKDGETSENIEFIYFKLPFLLKDRYTDRKKLL